VLWVVCDVCLLVLWSHGVPSLWAHPCAASFQGPNSVAFDNNGTLYFTDGGAMGETTLEKPKGSVFYISGPESAQILRPLALNCLAHPCGIAVSKRGEAVYVAEMMRNRVLRFSQRPVGVYHLSVFCQMSGGMGPSCLALDERTGVLYVGQYDFKGACSVCATRVCSTQVAHLCSFVHAPQTHDRFLSFPFFSVPFLLCCSRERLLRGDCCPQHRGWSRADPVRGVLLRNHRYRARVCCTRTHSPHTSRCPLVHSHAPCLAPCPVLRDGVLLVTEGSKGSLLTVEL